MDPLVLEISKVKVVMPNVQVQAPIKRNISARKRVGTGGIPTTIATILGLQTISAMPTAAVGNPANIAAAKRSMEDQQHVALTTDRLVNLKVVRISASSSEIGCLAPLSLLAHRTARPL